MRQPLILRAAKWLLPLTLLLVAACGGLAVDPEADAAARQAYIQLRNGQDDALLASFAPEQRQPQALETLKTMRGLLPPGEPRGATISGWNNSVSTGQGRTTTLTHQYDYGDRTVTATSRLRQTDKSWELLGFHVAVNPAGAVPGATAAPAPVPPPESGTRI